ncbi:MAG: hypothetical protein WD990_01745 [Acidimicrobiia bacterium]
MRTTGRPPSANGASSFHLAWEPVPPPAHEVSVTLTIDHEPPYRHLVFWALQVDFSTGWGSAGGAHLGLQWNPLHPGSGAVNWGGYDREGRVLAGSRSSLSSAPDNSNTRDFAWSPGQPYRLTIRAGAERGHWTGSVRAIPSGHEQVIRDLYVSADALVRPMVWSEVFARCDDPPVAATWRDPVAHTARGPAEPVAYRVSYQSEEAGGCSNTDVVRTAEGIRQVTGNERRTPAGALVSLD